MVTRIIVDFRNEKERQIIATNSDDKKVK